MVEEGVEGGWVELNIRSPVSTIDDLRYFLKNYSVPFIVFRFVMSLLIEGLAIMCIKSYLPDFSIGKQPEAHLTCA